MRLLVSCVPFDGGKSGLSVYAREVVRELRAQGHDLTLVVDAGEGGQGAGRPTMTAPRWTKRPALSMLWHLLVLPFWIVWRRRDFDGFVICAANRRVCAWYPLPTVATVHDLANFHVPGKYSRLRMFYLAHVLPFFAKRAHHLVAVSGATKADIVAFWHCRPDAVTVLYNGIRREGIRRDEGIAPYRSDGCVLYISRIEHPGKNHVRLIDAYGRLPRDLAERHPLVLAGADWKDAAVVHDAAARSPHADCIRFTGFASDEELARLWDGAAAYVFPSLFEGFGLSLVEAMARGIPCACSANGSLGEIAGEAAVTFDPADTAAIAAALERLLTEPPAARDARLARGLARARQFSWADHARGLAALLGEEGGRPADASAVVRLFGIPVAKVTEADAVERIVALARERRAAGRPAAFVATLNVDFVSNAVGAWPFGGNGELWNYLRNADFVTADGMPLVVLSRLLRRGLPARVTGADLVPALCRRCADEGLSVYVLGGERTAVAAALARLGGRTAAEDGDAINCVPPLKVVGIDSAFVDVSKEQPDIVARINAAKPDVLFVALGNPKQELWMGRHAAHLDAGVMIGVGGAFNFLAGRVKRAPAWMQRNGLEWVWRVVQEPGRLWRRYAYGLVKFSYLAALQLAGRFGR